VWCICCGTASVTAARQDWDGVPEALKPIYTAPGEDATMERFLEFQEAWGRKYPAVVKMWLDAWVECAPLLSFDVEIRKVICSTNTIESVNAPIHKAVRARGHLPQRVRRPQVHLHGADEPRPDREGPQEVDHALEDAPERLPDRLRRPAYPGQQLNLNNQDQQLK
jgi:putative transposase